MENENEPQGEAQVIKLDGSMGLKDRALLTLITKDDVEGERRETFMIPTALLDMKTLTSAFHINFIKGFSVVRQETAPSEGE